MRKRTYCGAIACTGAVVGAGFSSGREVVAFFSKYGRHGIWLIAISVLVMAGLAYLGMKRAEQSGCGECWTQLFEGGRFPQYAFTVLLMIAAGAMLAAAGHMAALVLNVRHAYAFGLLGSLLAAWAIGTSRLKIMSVCSAVLSMLLLLALMSCLTMPTNALISKKENSLQTLLSAAFRAVGYAAMNMTLAISIVCAGAKTGKSGRTSLMFGWLMAVLLLVSHSLYAKHPELENADFPLVVLLSAYGRKGYLVSVLLLWFSVLTTLVSVLSGLRNAADVLVCHKLTKMMVVFVLPLGISAVGFSAIVDQLYAPAGLVCLLFVFLPLARGRQGAQPIDFCKRIQ